MSKLRTLSGDEIITVGPGFVGLFAADSPPEGWLAMNGAEISRAVYSKLFSVIGTMYGPGDGVSSFNLPNTSGVLYAADVDHVVGMRIAEGLPNITGTFISLTTAGAGAFVCSDISTYSCISGADDFYWKSFNASRSNSIYGSSEHVTPAGIAFLACIKY